MGGADEEGSWSRRAKVYWHRRRMWAYDTCTHMHVGLGRGVSAHFPLKFAIARA
jgi:hypothetical protein